MTTNPLTPQLIAVCRANQEDAFETRRKRFSALRTGLDTLFQKYRILMLQNLARKHITHLVETWKSANVDPRSLANKLTYLRWLLRKIGKQNLLTRQNAALGITPGARFTKAGHVVPDAYLNDVLAKVQDDPRTRAMILLGRYLGMRFKEASLFRPLKDWQNDRVYLTRGTKGGRPRYLWVSSPKQREVLEFVAKLVTAKDQGIIPTDMTTYRNWKQQTYDTLRAIGLGRKLDYEFHDLRRSFINDEMNRLRAKGHTLEEAAKIIAKTVGHNRTEVLRWYGSWN